MILEGGSVNLVCPLIMDPADEGSNLLILVLPASNVVVRLEKAIQPDVSDVEGLNAFGPTKAAQDGYIFDMDGCGVGILAPNFGLIVGLECGRVLYVEADEGL